MAKQSNDASGPAAGYLFQPEKALLRLARAPIDASIGVETGDDVVESRSGEVTHSEQLKNQQAKSGNPFANRSEALWKTLSIWVKNNDIAGNRAQSHLILSSNRIVPEDCLARTLDLAKDGGAVQQAVKKLKETGSNPSNSIREYADEVLGSTEERLMDIVARIRVDDSAGDIGGIRAQTIAFLQLPSNVDGEAVYNSLLGWLSTSLKELWDAGEAGWIRCEAFANQKQSVIDDYRRGSFSARTASAISVTSEEQDAKRGDLFVQQLQIIELDDDEILDAIIEVVRESKETTRLYRDGVITYQEFEERDERLHTRWKQIFRRNARSAASLTEEQIGFKVFYDTTDHNESIGTIKPIERYMTAGALHRLANDLENQFWIGWHPKFKQLLMYSRVE